MPVDSRRIQGPESSTPYVHFQQRTKEAKLLKKGRRRDGRGLDEMRQIFMKTGVVSQAKGSAYVEQGNTKVICSVYGPREVPRSSDFSLKGQLSCEFKYAPFSCAVRKGHMQDQEEMELSRTLQEALEPVVCLHQFPKALVEVNILVLENDGSVLAASLTCASLALADGNIPMWDLAIGAALQRSGDVTLVDPTIGEESRSGQVEAAGDDSNMMIGYMPSLQQVCTYFHEGSSSVDDLEKGISILVDNCKQLLPLVQDCIKQSIENHLRK